MAVAPPRPTPRRYVVVTVVNLLALVPTGLLAVGAMVATVMGVAAAPEMGAQVAGFAVIGIAIMATPVVLVGATIWMWVAHRTGRDRQARIAMWAPVPFLVLCVVIAGLVTAS
jgi:hypothetical protein